MISLRINHEIQALRGIAVLFVVVQHLDVLFFWAPHQWTLIGRGFWVGVDLFFCISGFVIAKDLLPRIEGKNGTEYWREIGAFWVRRLYRLSPSAWIWLAVPLLLTPFFQHLPLFSFNRANIADAVSAVLHVSNFRFLKCTNDFSGCGWFAHYWSLSLEEQFYLMLPVIFFFFRRFLVPVILVLVLSQLFLVRTQWNGLLAFIRTDALLLGVLLAMFSASETYKVLEPRIDKSYLRFVAAPMLLVCLVVTTRYEIVTLFNGLASLLCVLIIWLCSFDKGYFVQNIRLKRGLSRIGERSYAIYLIHMPAFWLTKEIWSRFMPDGFQFDGTFNVRFLTTAFVLTATLSELNLRLVERPLRRVGKLHSDRLLLIRV